MDKDTLIKLLASVAEEKQPFPEDRKQVIDIEKHIGNLKKLKESLVTKCHFQADDIVCWKEGLKNKRTPDYRVPAIVVEVLKRPLFDEKAEVGSPYFREKLDVVLGILVNSELLTFHYDSRRFELYEK